MTTVDKFLCYKLEVGGLVIGWLNLIGCISFAIVSLIGVILLGILNCDELKSTERNLFPDPQSCHAARGLFIGVLLFCIALCIGFAYMAWMCIQGTKARNHFRVKPLMILTAIAAVCSILEIFAFTASAIISGIIGAIINGYCYVVLYSLYSVFRMEYETGASRHQLRQPEKV